MSYRTPMLFLALVSLSACAEGNDPIYLTETRPTSDDAHDELMLPYFTRANTTIQVSLPAPAQSSSDTAASPPKKTEPSKKKPLATQEKPTPSPAIAIAAVTHPSDKQFLFFRSNGWYSSSAEFDTDAMGLPSKSDTSSTQQVGVLLTEIGSAAEGIAAMSTSSAPQSPSPTGTPTARDCITALTGKAPFAQDYPVSQEPKQFFVTGKVGWWIFMTPSDVVGGNNAEPSASSPSDGFYVYDPSTVQVSLRCFSSSVTPLLTDSPIMLLPSQSVGAYLVRRLINPQRNFWTNPEDTYTITDGMLVGHKYTEQSAAKTVVDIITSPIHAAIPSTSSASSTSTPTSTQAQTSSSVPN